MTAYYADTSMIAKRYIPEPGYKWVQSITAPDAGNIIVICQLTQVEMFSVFERNQRDNVITEADKLTFQQEFLNHARNEYLVVTIFEEVYERARLVVTRHRLRSLDAIQLASAIEYTSVYNQLVTFVSGDRKLLEAARAEGFQIDNPLDHA